MLSAIFTILLDIERLGADSNEDVWVLIAGVGLIILVFVLRRWLHSGGKNDKTNWLF